MSIKIYLLILLCAGILFSGISSAAATGLSVPSTKRISISLNSHWLFKSGDVPDGESDTLNEDGFIPVCLPHANAIVPHRNVDMQLFRKVSWYRRHFTPAPEYRNMRFIILFQGASQVTEVFVNGTSVGKHLGAYTPFSYDITKHLRFGNDNVIAAKVDSREHKEIPPEGKPMDFMLFGGITRDVEMIITGNLHIDWVFASRNKTDENKVDVCYRIGNNDSIDRDYTVEAEVVDAAGKIVATGKSSGSIKADSSMESTFITGAISKLSEWSIENPCLYTLHTRILKDTVVIDEHSEKIGIRSIAFSKTDGKFYLNGKPVKLNGLNRHETFPFIGRAAANRLQKKDADLLKYHLGCNIVRCSHYPQDPEFLERCDEIGLLVIEEIPGWGFVGDSAWRDIAFKNVEEMVIRDRNHPSLISYGVRVNQSPDFHDLYVATNRLARSLDPTRPTHGVRLKGRYSKKEFLEDIWTHNFIIPKEKPDMLPWLITESVGVGCQVHSWDAEEKLIKVMLRFAEVMDSVAMNPYIAGQIGWCAFDYNSPYPTADGTVCYYGASDMYRLPKHGGMFLKSQADPGIDGPIVYIAHTWKKQLTPNNVWVATNCDEVELFVNRKSLGRKKPDQYIHLDHPLAVWKDVRFIPGTIQAVGYIRDSMVAEHVRRTPGRAVALKLIPDDTELIAGGDMTRIVVVAVDRYGQTVPKVNAIVELSVSGAAEFLGQHLITLEDGKTAFFVQTKADQIGTVKCQAKGERLVTATIPLTVKADPQAAVRKKILSQ